MSVASITITSEREEVVDFTKPFMAKSLSVLMRVPHEETVLYLLFLRPLHWTVWALLGAVLVCVSIAMYITERLTPLTVCNQILVFYCDH